MPELPETETIARDLDRLARGLTIEDVRVERPDVLREVTPAGLRRRTRGVTIVDVRRRAKAVVVALESRDRLVVTPRFTGALQFDVPPDEYLAIALTLSDGHRLDYRDVRRLGTVALLDATRFERWSLTLGPEPIAADFTGAALSGIVRGLRSPIKKVLMDQRRVAGVGNIYANESLWQAGIDPSRSASTLTARECDRVAVALREILEASIAARGTTFRDYRDASGGRGGYAPRLRAYGRGGSPCPRCGTHLTDTHAVDGRSTVFCHRCQR